MSYTSSNRRLVSNTLFLYVRTFVLLVIGLLTSRITLQALGVDNYGIVNVVSGFVGMFAIVSGSLTSACQRFITYEIGKTEGDVRSVFSASLYIHIGLCLVILILGETVGLYFVNHKLNVPEGCQVAVQWVYQCSLVSFILSLINIPFNALIIAHERMKVFAYISLLEAVLKLIVVISLLYIPTNKLTLYAILGLASSIIVRLTFQIYCRSSFGDTISLRRKVGKSLSKQLFGFAGWSFVGNCAWIFSIQGVSIVINIFCGVVINAARGIAVLVESVVNSFVNNFTTAVNPQITKLYATGNLLGSQMMVIMSMRMGFFLMILLSLPIIISADQLLHIWFTEVPPYTCTFVRITMVIVTFQALGNPFLTLLLATGNIRNYQLCSGAVTFLNFPGAYLLLKFGESPVSIYRLSLSLTIIVLFVRFIFIKRQTNLSIKPFFIALVKLLPASIIATICNLLIFKSMEINKLLSLMLFGVCTLIVNSLIIFYLGLDKMEKEKVVSLVKSKIAR